MIVGSETSHSNAVMVLWQHYLGFILSKRAPPQGWNKKPWYVIL